MTAGSIAMTVLVSPGIPRTMALKAGGFLFKSSKSRLRNSGPEAVVERTFLQASPVRT